MGGGWQLAGLLLACCNAVEQGCARFGLVPCAFQKKLLCLFFFQELIALEQIVSNLRLIKHSK